MLHNSPMSDYKHVEMNEENKSNLAEKIAMSIASSGKEQYEVAYEGFLGINEMNQTQFNYACWYYNVGQE